MKFSSSGTKSNWLQMAAAATLSLTLIGGAIANAGTKDSGRGGNVRQSTRADLDDIVAGWPNSFWMLSDSHLFGNEIRPSQKPLKPDLAKINQRIMGIPYFTIRNEFGTYVRNLKFEIRDECFDGKESKDASTDHVLNAPICLSESRLSRFSKVALRTVLVPLVFHEVAHQYNLGEPEANAFQELAEVQLEYREVFLSALRARFQCAFASKALTDEQKNEVMNTVQRLAPEYKMKEWPKVPPYMKLQMRTTCAAEAVSTRETLTRIFDTKDMNPWAPLENKSLSKTELDQLLDYEHYSVRAYTYLTLEKGLKEPALTGYSDCPLCKQQGLDPYYLMMLAAKGSLDYIDQEVGRLQDNIKIE